MNDDAEKSEMTVLRGLGKKIGIAGLATPDFDLVCADANGVEQLCDQFDSIDLDVKERFYFMQLIVASLDEALRKGIRSAPKSELRIERLIDRDAAHYGYIIDYWGRTGIDIDLRVAPMMHRLKASFNKLKR